MWADKVSIEILLALETEGQFNSINILTKRVNTVGRECISRHVNILERQGYLILESPRGNQRVKNVILTPEGVLLASALLESYRLLQEGFKREMDKSKRVD